MNLKVQFQYTKFIYPFIVTNSRYKDFLGKFLEKDSGWNFQISHSDSDINTHAYFLPYVKKFLFPTLYWKHEFKQNFINLDHKRKVNSICKLPSATFEYKMEGDFNKNFVLNETGVNFDLSHISLVCFDPGICFLIIKTEIDTTKSNFSNDILDFNYKFRTINPRYLKKKKTEGIFLNSSEFEHVEDLSGFIDKLLHGFEDVEKENVYFDRLFTYSYMCLDESEWNENKDLSEIVNEFYKFQYILPGNYGSTFDSEFMNSKDNTYTRWKYSIYGFSREAGVVFSSARESFNLTKLPNYYDSMYFYIFLLAFYQRVSLILFSEDLMTSGNSNIEHLKNKFTKFTHFSWFSQITNSEQGMDIWKKWQKAFDLPALFDEVQKEYGEFYDFTVARGQERINLLLIFIYTLSVAFSGLTLLLDFHYINTNNQLVKVITMCMLLFTIFIYPIYLMAKTSIKVIKKRKHRD